VLAVNPVTLQVLATAATGDQPWGVAVDERANRVYVASFGSGDVRIYEASSLALLATVPVGAEATLVEVLPELGTAFALVHDGSHVAVIEGLTRTMTLSSGGSGPFGIAADPLRGQVYISHRDSAHFATVSRVSSRNANTWQTRSNLVLEDGRRLFEIAYDAAVNRLYSVYMAADGQWYVDTWKPEPYPQLWGREATVAVESSGVITSPLVGGAGLAVNSANGLVYNANTAAGTVSVIERGGLRVLDTIATRGDPFAIAADGVQNRVYIGLRESGRLIILK
jgi:YVTN family beta-propeller protein